MAVIRFHSTKSNTLYSSNPLQNTGLDQILELTADKLDVSRILMSFDKVSLFNTVENLSTWEANLRLYCANDSGLPEDYLIQIYNTGSPWKEGTGSYLDYPYSLEASTWKYNNTTTASEWVTAIGGDVTGSYSPGNEGGGNWHTTPVIDINNNKFIDKDLYADVTSHIERVLDNLNPDIIVKLADNHEFNYNERINIKYFSEDTNTIYKPVLEISYDDSVYNPSGSIITNQDVSISLNKNPTTISLTDIVTMNLFVKPKINSKNYSTVYSTPKSLQIPSDSWWQLRDYDTNEIVIPGSLTRTKLSCSLGNNFFKFYPQNLYVNRYYCFDIFIKVGNDVKSYTPDYIFRIVK